MLTNASTDQPSRSKVILALVTVYLIWGSTYFGIRFAIESIPPLTMAGARFFIAGLILYIFARSTKGAKPTQLEWRDATIIGASLIMCGNGGVTFAEKYLPSGMVAMLVATVPVYMTLFAWGIGMSSRPSYKTFLALLIGITGVFILTSSHEAKQTNQDWTIGITIPLIGSAIWAGGSLFAKKAATPSSSNLSIGMQMITGGALLLCLGLAFGEWRQLHFELLSANRAAERKVSVRFSLSRLFWFDHRFLCVCLAYKVLLAGFGGNLCVYESRCCSSSRLAFWARDDRFADDQR